MDAIILIFNTVFLLLASGFVAWNICAFAIVVSYHWQKVKHKQELKKLQEKWRLAK